MPLLVTLTLPVVTKPPVIAASATSPTIFVALIIAMSIWAYAWTLNSKDDRISHEKTKSTKENASTDLFPDAQTGIRSIAYEVMKPWHYRHSI